MSTNTEILRCPKSLLTPLEQQTKFLLERAAAPMPCPICKTLSSLLHASGVSLNEFNAGSSDTAHKFHCVNPKCGVELKHCLDFYRNEWWEAVQPHLPKK